MTEADWNTCTSPETMLDFLLGTGRASERKLRLFLVACCRAACDSLYPLGGRTHQAVEVAERYADGQAGDAELDAAQLETVAAMPFAARGVCVPSAGLELATEMATHARPDRAVQAGLLRDLFGPLPFRPVTVDAPVLAWYGGSVVRLARLIYDERKFECMPELGDALEAAGCRDDDILGHCRGPGPHARGCWLVDLLLKKQ
jgi:hypothetical protein